MRENSPSGTPILVPGSARGRDFVATDPDGDELAYRLDGEDAWFFELHYDVKKVPSVQTRTGARFDYETKDRYSFRVTADDGNGGTASLPVRVDITDDARAPVPLIDPFLQAHYDEGTPLDSFKLAMVEGTTATWSVALAAEPRGMVEVAVGVDPDLGVTVSPARLEFSDTSWMTPQTVTVTAPADSDSEGDTVSIRHAMIGTDPPVAGQIVELTVIDGAAPDILVGRTELTVAEGGETATYDVRLATQPTGTVTVTVEESDEVDASPGTLVFTPSDWDVAQTVLVRAVDDLIGLESEWDEPVTLGHAARGANYDGLAGSDVGVRVRDNDILTVSWAYPGRTVTALEGIRTALLVSITPAMDVEQDLRWTVSAYLYPEGFHPATFTSTTRLFGSTFVKDWTFRDAAPVVDEIGDYGLKLTDDNVVTGSRNFFLVMESEKGEPVRYDVRFPHPGSDTVQWVRAADEEFPKLTLNGDSTITLDEGQSREYTVELDFLRLASTVVDPPPEDLTEIPSHPSIPGIPGIILGPPGTVAIHDTEFVDLALPPPSTVDVTVSTPFGGGVTVSPSVLTFEPDARTTPQTVTVTAEVDTNAADETALVTHTADGSGYERALPETLTVNTVDVDHFGVNVSETSLSFDEADAPPPTGDDVIYGEAPEAFSAEPGTTATLTVELQAAPDPGDTVAVTVRIVGLGAGDDVKLLEAGSESFGLSLSSPGTIGETVTLAIRGDADTSDDVAVVRLEVWNSADTAKQFDGPSVQVTIVDDDVPGLVISPAAAEHPEPSVATDASYSVGLAARPSGSVTVTPAIAGSASIAMVPVSLIFTPSDYRPKEVTYTISPDPAGDDAVAVIAHAASGGSYDEIDPDDPGSRFPVRVRDSTGKPRQVTLEVQPVTVDEGESRTLRVVGKLDLSARAKATTVRVAVAGASATAGADFAAVPEFDLVIEEGRTESEARARRAEPGGRQGGRGRRDAARQGLDPGRGPRGGRVRGDDPRQRRGGEPRRGPRPGARGRRGADGRGDRDARFGARGSARRWCRSPWRAAPRP